MWIVLTAASLSLTVIKKEAAPKDTSKITEIETQKFV